MSDDPPRDSAARDILQYSFLRVFANDGTIDAGELEFMKRLALKDGRVDDEEREVLSRIFGRIGEDDVEPGVWAEIVRFKAEQGIG